MEKKRSWTGLSKPNCFSRSAISSGSSPYVAGFWVAAFCSIACDDIPVSPPPLIADVVDICPIVALAMICSMGPPGANCTIVKLIRMTPNNVGIISNRRRKTYLPIDYFALFNDLSPSATRRALFSSHHHASKIGTRDNGEVSTSPNLSQCTNRYPGCAIPGMK